MSVRAKFLCISVTKHVGGKYNADGKYEAGVVHTYKFSAVSSGSEENKSFFASTPSGTIELSAVRDDLFEINKEYYLDFSPSE